MDGNHLMYSKAARHVITTYLHDHYSPQQAEMFIRKLQDQYEDFLKDLPELGGRKNSQAQSVYDCIALFALYEILPSKPTLGVFEALVGQVFVPAYRRVGFVNLNWKPVQKLAAKIFAFLAKKGRDHASEWAGNYHMEAEPYDPEIGVRFHFTSCPIADFAQKHGYIHLMPAMCNPDYQTLEAIQAGLIRTKTCATDDCCDYWLVGSNSPHLKEHPLYTDENGFLKNK